MATSVDTRDLVEKQFGATLRRDDWKTEPIIYFTLLSAFVIYSTWAAVFGARHVAAGPYLSPMYSPLLIFDLPTFITPAMLILWAPAGFRFTCYYYRKAYYRSFAAQPYACGVGKPWSSYNGERKVLLFQNLHRFFLYLAIAFIFILGYDAWIGFFGWSPAGYEPVEIGASAGSHLPHHPLGQTEFGVGVGSIVLLINVILLAGYTFGCHSLRHLTGGCLDCPSKSPVSRARFKIWRGVTWLNERHMWWAWCSLIWVGFTDFYVRAVSMGWIPNDRFI